MLKKMIPVLCLISLSSFSLFSQTEADFMENALKKIEEEINEAKSLEQRAIYYQDLEKWFKLLVKLDLPKEKKYAILKHTYPIVERLSEKYIEYITYFMPTDEQETVSVVYQGKETEAYKNLDPERYEEEVESYNKNKSFEKTHVVKDNLKEIKTGTHYNFVLTTEGELICTELQEYDELFTADKKKILLAPNHALLADGKPVLSAGEFILLTDGDFTLVQIGMTSGHYHPAWAAKEHIEKKFLDLGFSQEQIQVFGFHIHKLGWKFLEKNLEE